MTLQPSPRSSGPASVRAIVVVVLALFAGADRVEAETTDASSTARPVSTGSAAERLRRAWIDHRLHGDLAAAESGYRAVTDRADAPSDVRARAWLGLSILAGEAGDTGPALSALDALASLDGVSVRWRDTARLLRARWEGTEVPDATPPDFLVELEGQVAHLQREIERLQGVVATKESALEDQARLLERQEEIRREAAASIAAALRREERQERDADELLLSLSERERQREFLERAMIGESLVAGLEAFAAADFMRAANETKKILAIDPDHREATQLAAHCRLVLAWSAGREAFDPPAPGHYRGPREAVLPLTTAVMRASLTRAIHAQEAGRTLDAMAAATRVLEEYAWCPVPLPPDDLEELVGTAERILDECLGGGAGQETVQQRALREEQLRLVEVLRRDFGKLVATELALDRAGDTPVGVDPGAGDGDLAWVLSETEATLRAAEKAITDRRGEEAIRHLRDLGLLIGWFPELDRDGKVAAQLELQISALERSLQSTGGAPDGETSPGGESSGAGSPAGGESERAGPEGSTAEPRTPVDLPPGGRASDGSETQEDGSPTGEGR